MDFKKNISLYRKDFPRLKAKVYYKFRQLCFTARQGNIRYGAVRKLNKITNVPKEIPQTVYMTKIVNPSAGIGDQLASWITGCYYAELFEVKYAYSSLYPQKWNDFLGFQVGAITTEELIRKYHYKKVWLPLFDAENNEEKNLIKKIIRSYHKEKVIFFLELKQIYGEQYGIIETIRPRFHAAHQGNEGLIYNPELINIALHIRRGDIVQDGSLKKAQLKNRWLDNSYYFSVLDIVMKLLDGKNVKIYIFTQGKDDEFQEFQRYGQVELCNNMSAMDSFLHMVKADILITSRSSFSYKPALLSYGIKICPNNFWHGYPELEEWIVADEKGYMNNNMLKEMINKKLRKG